jgi:hypothetical protein
MAKKIIKAARHGLTRKEWVNLITACLAAVGRAVPKIEFTPDGINVEEYAIGFGEQEEKTPTITRGKEKVLRRGYTLTVFVDGYSYTEGPSCDDYDLGFFVKPIQIMHKICELILNERLNGIWENVTIDRQIRQDEKDRKELEEFYVQQQQESQKEDDTNLVEDESWRDRLADHNRQVLSRL